MPEQAKPAQTKPKMIFEVSNETFEFDYGSGQLVSRGYTVERYVALPVRNVSDPAAD